MLSGSLVQVSSAFAGRRRLVAGAVVIAAAVASLLLGDGHGLLGYYYDV